jgi:hypothetical protein
VLLYSERGAPLTRDATQLYDQAVDIDLADMGVTRLSTRAADNGTGDARALPETCPGYTSGAWGKCPAGLVCDNTYKVRAGLAWLGGIGCSARASNRWAIVCTRA